MKNHVLIISLLLFPLKVTAGDVCLESTSFSTAETLAEQNCEITDRAQSCAEKSIPTDVMEKRFDTLMNFAENNKEKVQQNKAIVNQNLLAQLFHLDPDEERYARDRKLPYPRTLIDWLSDDGKAEGLDLENVKTTMKANYVAFAKKHDCNPVIKHGYIKYSYPSSRIKDKKELDEIISSPNYQKEKDAYFEEFNSKFEKHGTFCEKKRMLHNGPYHIVSETFPPCTGNVSGVFKDNDWKSSSLDQKLSGDAADEVVACIKDRLARGGSIHHISVVSSASALNNSGDAAKMFCKKGFLGLSKARAETAQKNILPILFSKAGTEASKFSSKVQLSYAGTNGDGTSGPCPYEIVDGQEVLKEEYRSPEGKKSLDDHKYIKIHVTFNSQKVAVNNKEEFYQAPYSCRRVYFECAPVSAK